MNQKVIKPGIVRRMVERIESSGQSISPEMADMCITAFLDTVADILSEGDTAILRGYMNIYPKYCKSKEVKNVMDKSRVTIPAHYKAGKKLNEACQNLIYYTLDKNVYFKTKKRWGYKKVKVSASDLVIQTFIVNYDMQNNTKVWHTDNNMKDNYYKHLYPVTELQYEAIKKVYDDTGVAAEEQIMSIVNSVEYKYNGWNPKCFKRTYEGKGYIGTNDVDCKSPEYLRWTNMIQRCYNKNVHKYKPYYKDKKVCEEWLNFANFRIWYREHIIEGAKVDLDKDILCQGNKVYGPETCVFVEHYINTVFERSVKRRIVQNKEKQYEVYMIVLNKNILFGKFDTKEEAEKGYITGKKDYILKLADSCKGKVQDCLYNAMVNWNVGIAD